MEGERILKSLLNGQTDSLLEDTKNYLVPLETLFESKNGAKVADKTVSKYSVFCTKFLRCAIEALKVVKSKGDDLDEIIDSLNLVSTLLVKTLTSDNGKYLKYVPSLDQFGKMLYLITVQLITKDLLDQAFFHASHLLRYVQLLKKYRGYGNEKVTNDFASLSLRMSDLLLQGAAKLENTKTIPADRQSHLCVILEWRKLSLLFQAETVSNSSVKYLVDRTLKCATKYQMDCGPKNFSHKTLASFFESVFNALISRREQLMKNSSDGNEVLLSFVELGFHYGRICHKAGNPQDSLAVFGKLLEVTEKVNHTTNGHSRLPWQTCLCICLISKAGTLLNCSKDLKPQTLDSVNLMLFQTVEILNQVRNYKSFTSPALKLLSDSLEYFRIVLETFCNNHIYSQSLNGQKTPYLLWRTFQGAAQLLQMHAVALDFQREQLRVRLKKADAPALQLRQQLDKITDRQLTVLNFVISLHQEQLRCGKNAKDCNKDSRLQLASDCLPVAQQASELIHGALADPAMSVSNNELRWLGCNVYNLGCMLYQGDGFVEAVPLLTLACDELKQWCFAAENEEQVLERIDEIKLLTKYALLSDCQRRSRQLRDAVTTATMQVLITLQTINESDVIKLQVKGWTAAKHELVKNIQGEEKRAERARTLCSALAEHQDASDIDSSQLLLVLEEELTCYRAKSYDSTLEEIAVIRQLIELYSMREDVLSFGSSTLEMAIVLHSVDVDPCEDRSALDYCQEAVTILTQLCSESETEEEANSYHLSHVQDRLAAAYMWQALLEHEVLMKSVKPMDDCGTEEDVGISLEEPFIFSLHSALDKWKVLARRASQHQFNGKVDLRHYYNAEETCHYQLITAGIYGLLNQPFNRVQALHLAATTYKAIGTQEALDTALVARSEAVHTLCDILDISHASLMLTGADDLLDSFEPSAVANVQFLLCKSHYLLVSGKYAKGEETINVALKSDVLMQKNYKSHLLKARLNSICMKYLLLPPDVHNLMWTLDPMLGSMTALEAAMDGFRKLSSMGEEMFGQQVFFSGKNSSKSKGDERGEATTACTKKAEGLPISFDTSQSTFQLSLLLDLLSSLLQVGQLYAHQGAVREAYRQFVDGLSLARHFRLPYRVAEFLVNIGLLDMKQGKTEKSQLSFDKLKAILQPVLKCSSKEKFYEEAGIGVPTFMEHPNECGCTICMDPVLHVILIDFFLSRSDYLAGISRQEQSINALEVAESVCETVECKITNSLEKLTTNLGLEPKVEVESNLKMTKKKRRGCKSSKTAKTKQGSSLKCSSISQLMLSQHYATLYLMNSRLLLKNGKIEKAMEVLSGALDFLNFTEEVSSALQVASVPIKASLIHLYGLTCLLCTVERSSDSGLNCKWFPKMGVKDLLNKGTTLNTADTISSNLCSRIEDNKELNSRKGSNSRTARNSNSAEPKTVRGNGKKKTSGEKSSMKEQRADAHDKANRNTKESRRTMATSSDDTRNGLVDKGSRYLDQAVQHLNEAFALCQACPPPELFSSICKALGFCYGRLSPEHSMCHLSLSSSVTLRHQAIYSSGKRIRRLVKDLSLNSASLDHGKDLTHLANQLSSLSLKKGPASCIPNDVRGKLKQLVQERNVMMFKSGSFKDECFITRDEGIAQLQNMPKEWTVCTLVLFQLPGRVDKELMICRMRAGCEPLLVKINTVLGEEKDKECTSSSTVDQVVMDLTKLFQCSVEQEFSDIMNDSIKSMAVDDTSEWCAKRTRLDKRMKSLLEKLEASWLGRWKGVLLGQSVSKEHKEAVASATKQLHERIQQIIGTAPDLQLLEVIIDSSSHLSNAEIKEAFCEMTGLDEDSSHLTKITVEFEEIIDSLSSFGDKKSTGKRCQTYAQPIARHPVILILGKEIQHLPWESIPILYNHPVTRVPSLQFLLSKLSCEKQMPEVDPRKTYYILNPQNNLPGTQKMFQKWFESEDGWKGIIGRAPMQKEFSSALTDHELFIYFGHGTGREFLVGDDIQRLDCRAVTLLMGCSSGKLVVEGGCEPRGMVLNYLLAGCPAIVADLWDVTDKDIDRFSESLLKLWLKQSKCPSLPEAVSQSRKACKLKYLIGASPVVYGLPAYVKD